MVHVRFFYFIAMFSLCRHVYVESVVEECSGGAEYSVLGMKLQRHTFKKITGAPMGDVCLRECYNDVRCQSFNYVISKYMCELNNRTKEGRPEDNVPDSDRYYFKRDRNRVRLGSTPELPAESCHEIKASEGKWAVGKKYWIYFAEIEKTLFVYCNMKTEDANECNVPEAFCDVNAECRNTLGSYLCLCNPGFTGDGRTCNDIDECQLGSYSCLAQAQCVNVPGSYKCKCPPGYEGDGKTTCKAFNAVFTNLNATGRLGPTTLADHYTGKDHDGQVTLSSGIQQWTVPYTGEYRIEAIGAAGGYDISQNSALYRGRGARMIGTFSLSKGEIIKILVGQEGGINTKSTTAGGGGGTFVVRGSSSPLIIAGGGGGIDEAQSRHAGCDASTNTTGNPGYQSWSGGSNGDGAQTADDSNSGGGGGGFYSSGRSAKVPFNGTMGHGGEGGKGFLQGGEGGRSEKNNVDGGFGGGGGAEGWGDGGGGGGGYSGGSSGDGGASDKCGGGGGSYNNGTNQQNECCYKTAGHGQVTFTLL